MGAFSFAADTLATLSSAFSPKSAPVTRSNVSKISVALDNNAQRMFTEFSTGMKMLNLHGVRNPCNITKIANQNLKLLYTNLKSNNSYRKAVSEIRSNAVDTQHWAWLPLIANQDIEASMLFLPVGTGVPAHITDPHNNQNQQVHDHGSVVASQDHYYISLLGFAELDIANRSRTSTVSLKSGDVFAETSDQTRIKQIRAIKGSSLILKIKLHSI